MLNKSSLIILTILTLVGCSPSDNTMRSSVVKLVSDQGSCSGTQIKAPSGKKYILTAGHCDVLINNGSIEVQTEDGGRFYSKVILEDDKSDLMLLEAAPGVPARPIADDIFRFEDLVSYTHGNGYPTYKTTGQFIAEEKIQVELREINSDEDRAKCSQAKHKIEKVDLFGVIQFELCTLKVVEAVTSIKVVPGSSGGIIANIRGELVGVVSAGIPSFSYIVTLKDIHNFLSTY